LRDASAKRPGEGDWEGVKRITVSAISRCMYRHLVVGLTQARLLPDRASSASLIVVPQYTNHTCKAWRVTSRSLALLSQIKVGLPPTTLMIVVDGG
jgi:hypothetical protein